MARALAMAQGMRCEVLGFRANWLPTGDELSPSLLASCAASISRSRHRARLFLAQRASLVGLMPVLHSPEGSICALQHHQSASSEF